MKTDMQTENDVQILEDLINAYVAVHAAGGSLHIVLEDQMWDRNSIQFCLERAIEKGDIFGECIARTLRMLPDSFYQNANDLGFYLAAQIYRQTLVK